MGNKTALEVLINIKTIQTGDKTLLLVISRSLYTTGSNNTACGWRGRQILPARETSESVTTLDLT